MSSLISKLASELSSHASSHSGSQAPSDPNCFLIRSSPRDSSVLLVHQSGIDINAPALYSVNTSKTGLEIFQGNPNSGPAIGNALIHKWNSSSADMTLHGRPVKMEISMSSGHTKYETQSLGKSKWKYDSSSSSGLILVDEGGRKIAKYGSAGSFGGKKLELLVPAEKIMFEEILFGAIAAKGVNKAANDAAFKVLRKAFGGI